MNKVRAVVACRIAGFDRAILNDQIAKGVYTEAPAAGRGFTRWFDEIDILGLVIWHQLCPLKSRVDANKAVARSMKRARSGDFGLVILPESNPADPLWGLVTIRFDLRSLMDYVQSEMQNVPLSEVRFK
jgi:hypothetical protein